ncbi:hypothetical protein Htur_1836 [Haloterrigena turkmenica DSM 5511]|uniref:Uncharacterized protein n=1 Tax=Haloterrigena turkmenica (strain ATCC 51198 / DSM 5511 / JCM 9101 / NCIMB 13204 / VKM B-1734 / 4k) TaxID=543526 RepID=D2RSE0_HALTV|nr:hypothetical protein Htur_1836 [Haloterrigena turkmenica DSM 5511]
MGQRDRFNGDTRVLHQRAVRTPLPNLEAERVFHENMMTVAAARERKADLLADPDVPLLDAYEAELERVAESFERRLRRIVGDDYREVAMAHHRGERDDRLGELAAYYVEGLWRIQQRTTVTDMLFSPLILRYPDSFTTNIRFAGGYTTPKSIRYESPEHSSDELPDDYAETYYEESRYSQRRAATYLRETAEIIRKEFPDPDETTFEERKYGGIVSAGGRRGSVFSAILERVEPDSDRFSEPVDVPTLVEAGPEARRTERSLRLEGEIVG